jgi:hypothetical protein
MTGRAAGGNAAGGTAVEGRQKEHLPGDPDLVPARHDITVDELRAAFPEWHIVQRLGVWWAIRGGLQHWVGSQSLIHRAMSAESLSGLAEKLDLQTYLDGLDADGLAEVYRTGTLPQADKPGERLEMGS